MNRYLEKIASMNPAEGEFDLTKSANAYKQFLAAKGQNVSGMSTQSLMAAAPQSKGSFTRMSDKATKMGSPKAVNNRPFWKADPLKGMKAQPLSEGAKSKLQNLAQTKTSLGSALASNASAKAGAAAQAEAAASKGILGKAMGFAKKNPLIAAGGALAGGLAIGKALSPSQPQQSYPQYLG